MMSYHEMLTVKHQSKVKKNGKENHDYSMQPPVILAHYTEHDSSYTPRKTQF